MSLSSSSRSLVSPVYDVVAAGGLSVVVCVVLAALGTTIPPSGAQPPWLVNLALAAALLWNFPHFAASYGVLYRSRAMVRRHPWVAIGIPVAILAIAALCFVLEQWSNVPLRIYSFLPQGYLAVHYTGQTFGMVASFLALSKQHLDKRERSLVRASLWVMCAWHVAWALDARKDLPPSLLAWTDGIYRAATLAMPIAIALGLAGFFLLRRRTGSVPLVAFVPWLANSLWYALMARDDGALFVAQSFHALQYLAFPMMVGLNRAPVSGGAASRPLPVRALLWWAIAFVVGAVLFEVLPSLAGYGLEALGAGDAWATKIALALPVLITVHHYFIDGAIWRLREPEVRRDLFAHLQ